MISKGIWDALENDDEPLFRHVLDTSQPKNAIDSQRTEDRKTALMIACQRGNLPIVELCLSMGAHEKLCDSAGWTACEYAAFNGHLAIAQKLSPSTGLDTAGGPAALSSPEHDFQVIKFDREENHAVVNLGITQHGQAVTAIELAEEILATDTAVSLVVTSTESDTPEFQFELPIVEDLIDTTMVFPIKDIAKARLNFRVYQSSLNERKPRQLVGSGIALLSDERNRFGTNRESLVREHKVPLISATNFDFLGSVTVTFILAKPFPHLKTPQWNLDGILHPPRLVGHRGMGMNDNARERLQIGENTVQSFVTASELGASFVEFDVQMTRDLVPVLLHNYALSETGTDIPVHELSLEQFMYVSKKQSPHGDPISTIGDPDNRGPSKTPGARLRSRSETQHPEQGAKEVLERMRYTVEFMHRGFKANTRGDFIQDSFATLAEALREVPEHVGFNIEIKYPRRFESESIQLAPVVLELNAFLDAVLNVIHTAPRNRNRQIILSSFTPDVCILLSLKQKAFPVFLISNVGKPPMFDKELRGASIRIAVKFALKWGLRGVVFLADAFVMCPRLVRWVKNRGLVVGSYGTLNNDPANVKAQLDAGVDLIYTDRVGLNAKALPDAFVLSEQSKR